MESVSNASTDSGRSGSQDDGLAGAVPQGKHGVGGARLGKTLFSIEQTSFSFSFLIKNSVDSGISIMSRKDIALAINHFHFGSFYVSLQFNHHGAIYGTTIRTNH